MVNFIAFIKNIILQLYDSEQRQLTIWKKIRI
jgi:hypothetical protein